MTWVEYSIIVFAVLILFLLSGTPIAVSLGLVGIISAYVFLGKIGALGYAYWNICCQFIFVAMPLFILMGQLLRHSGLSYNLYEGATALLGKLPGGLLHSNILSCSIFAAMSGSSLATAATIGTIAIPELKKRGYERTIVLGSLAAGGTLGILIPPSVDFIIYGAITGQSIGALFIAGIIPGIILSLLFMGYILGRTMMKPQLAPTFEGMPLKRRVLSIIGMWPVVSVIFVVIGGIYLGVVTPTEAAALGVSLTLVFTLAFRRLNWQILKTTLRDTIKTATMLMFLLIGAQLLSATLGILRVPDDAVRWVASLPVSPLVILIGIYFLYLVLGCLMDGISIMVMSMPFIFPIIVALGFDPIWFGVVLVINLEIGMITPPVGLNCYVIHGLYPDNPLSDVFIGITPFFFMMVICLAIITAFPVLATWLPSTMR